MCVLQVAYFYDAEVGNYYYGQGHPMKPHRIRMAHNLLLHYGVYKNLDVYKPVPANFEDLTRFHSDDYIEFMRKVTPENQYEFLRELKRYNVGEDCPVFDGLYDYCRTYTGGSMGGALKINRQEHNTVINWAGGLHHAKKSEASGFCYVNDIVLATLELLKHHQRVLYIDIDIHHGDGVEEAFYTTDRVMTVSFHKFGEYFPGTGDILDVGYGKGRQYSLNVPLRDGIDDATYETLFKPVMQRVMESYDPGAVVFQSGADSLSGDRLGCFNLSIQGHAECLKFIRSFGKPMLVLGGGGYTIRNVARCWAYETSCLVDMDLEDKLPPNEYYEYFGPDYRLHFTPSNMENLNTPEFIERIKTQLLEQLQQLGPPPSVQVQPRPPDDPRAVAEAEAREAARDEADPDAPAAKAVGLDREGGLKDEGGGDLKPDTAGAEAAAAGAGGGAAVAAGHAAEIGDAHMAEDATAAVKAENVKTEGPVAGEAGGDAEAEAMDTEMAGGRPGPASTAEGGEAPTPAAPVGGDASAPEPMDTDAPAPEAAGGAGAASGAAGGGAGAQNGSGSDAAGAASAPVSGAVGDGVEPAA